jgi:uncharacterized protein YeaC (DUF1315 family)
MNYRETIEGMPRETYDRLRQAVELGRWPDGRALAPEQRENALQAVIAWGEMHLPPEERVGFLDRGRKADACADDGVQPLTVSDPETDA